VPDKTVKIIEVGSGLGYLTYAIAKRGYAIHGMDISEQAVHNAADRFGDLYFCDDLFEFSKKAAATYDIVIMTEVLEHTDDPIAFVNALRFLLRPGGVLLLTTPNKSVGSASAIWQSDSPPVHLWWFSESSARQIAIKTSMNLELWDFSEFNARQVLGIPIPVTHHFPNKPFLRQDGEPAVTISIDTPSFLRRIKSTRFAKRHLASVFELLHRFRRTKPFMITRMHLMGSRANSIGIVLTRPAQHN
jgi:SAM-dependent methyltransferase